MSHVVTERCKNLHAPALTLPLRRAYTYVLKNLLGLCMNTSPAASSDTGALDSPCSVSLKINASSVMLYRNVYLKGTGNKRGLFAQEYVCSFSIHETDIPQEFQERLRQATLGNPERYKQLVQAIHDRALVPARQRREEKELQEQRSRIKGCICFARLQLNEAAGYAYRDIHLADPEIQQEVRLALEEAKRLVVQPTRPHVVDAHAQRSADPARSEQRLQQLLAGINHACREIQQMMPMSGKQFGRGYDFSADTVQQVQQMWFNTSDAIAVLNQRQQLKRPAQWSERRQDVTQPSSASGAHMTSEILPG